MPQHDIALEVQNLGKTYKSGHEALKGISFTVNKGDFYALLGPNGAGKSTTIGILTGLINKSYGKANILGYDIDSNFPAARSLTGVVPQEHNFSLFQNCRDIVINQAGYYGIPRHIGKIRCDYYLRKLGLVEKSNVISRNLSGGMRRKLMLARALVHQPELLFLDEPTAGLDVEFRRELWDVLRELNDQGTTIVLTTHYLEEVERLCNRVAIIQDGKIISDTSLQLLLRSIDCETYIIDSSENIVASPVIDGYTITMQDANTLSVEVKRKQGLDKLFTHLAQQGIKVSGVRNKSSRLEELFIRMTTEKNNAAQT